MTAVRNIQMLMRYTAWANARLYAALAEVPVSVLLQARPGRAGGLAGTLGHAWVVDMIWKGHLEGRPHGFTTRQPDGFPSLAELHALQDLSDQWYVGCAGSQSDDCLAEVIDFEFVDGGAGSLSRGDILLHVVNHKTYHWGYVADMLYESGLKPPTMDLPVFLRDSPPPG